MQGSFRTSVPTWKPTGVFPARAGIFPKLLACSRHDHSLPRACGDLSGSIFSWATPNKSYPRGQGSFLDGFFSSSRVPDGLPRECGDFSVQLFAHSFWHQYSPRMRGSFLLWLWHCLFFAVFLAYAGIFLISLSGERHEVSLPRACGDISFQNLYQNEQFQSSPRKRGLFFKLRLH